VKIEIDTSTIGSVLGGWLHAAVVWGVRKAVPYAADKIITAVCVVVLLAFLGGHTLMPTGGCTLPVPIPVPPAPPAPADPLTVTLQVAYAADADAGKADKLAALASLYGNVVSSARVSGNVTTLGQLQTAVHAAADIAIGKGGMANLRGAVSKYVAGKMPATDGPLTDALWLDATTAYAEVAQALKGVK
jgi:hypothetical protein